MGAIPFEYGLALAGVLFVLGLVGVLVRRNLLFILLCVEIMLNAAAWPSSSPEPAGRSRTGR